MVKVLSTRRQDRRRKVNGRKVSEIGGLSLKKDKIENKKTLKESSLISLRNLFLMTKPPQLHGDPTITSTAAT